ncbi:selenocysteine-specific translation elongation factor [Helicobacter sp. MIT 99-5507]|uniref:selenocysteine-specific translation elongation factor n=1 Tax=Helicobacter sp. MIT 99-5507 TaxID=152489 RepID=UPI000E1E2FD6|nr:selenocysteine-specific translation elongation factor [Helicobacter sp. MIT 99-5507]RDU58512.1 selenocysteine-specific translation elongation factor [Helicobacter sp. MIT 99-5507]
MNNLIIGLSGHIDHGKTSFIKAINNYDGDIRSDEKARGMTIDISFSNVILGDNHISFIDVPGHEKLVKNMISGAFGIDILVFIVAADDGIMEQSIEHLNIAKLLGIKEVLVFVSKSDLATKERIKEVKQEIIKLIKKLDLNLIEISEFSIHKAELIKNAKEILSKLKNNKKESGKFFRYYIDRVFSKKGFGSIVTGTILSGQINKNDKILVCDLGKETIIKNLQNHDKEVENATIAQRIALNLTIPKENLKKGMLLCKKGILRGFDRVDCVIFPIQKIINNQNAVFFIGSKKINATINILEENDTRILATLKLDEVIFSTFKERFILRDNMKTIGGGMILNPITDPMKKAQKIQYLKYLYDDDFKNAFKILIDAHKCGFGLLQSLQRFNLTSSECVEIAKNIDDIFCDKDSLVIYNLESKNIVKNTILNLIKKNKNAIFSANSISNELKWSSPNFNKEVIKELESKGIIKKSAPNLYISTKSNIDDVFSYAKEEILKILQDGGMTPIAPYNIYDDLNIDRKLGDDIFKNLTKTKKVVRLSHNIFILTTELNKIMQKARDIIKTQGYIDIASFKKHFNISRKYIIAYLDYLDNYGDIKKEDNKRMLR